MSEEINPTIAEQLTGWATSHKEKPEKYIKIFMDKMVDVESHHPSWSVEKKEERAISLARAEIKALRRSPAIYFTGFILGASAPRDIYGHLRVRANQAAQEDFDKAVRARLVNPDGEPLDTRKNLSSGKPNPNYMKKVPPAVFIKNVVGAVAPETDPKAMKPFVMNMTREMAQARVPIGIKAKFRANMQRRMPEDRYLLNSSVYTRFEELPDESWTEQAKIEMLQKHPGFVPLGKLMDWNAANVADMQKVIVTEGDVVAVSTQPSETGNLRMVLEDTSLGMDADPVTVFMSGDMNIDFGPGSRVLVIGRLNVGRGLNRETGQLDPNIKVPVIAGYGIYSMPEFRRPPEEVSPQEFKDVNL